MGQTIEVGKIHFLLFGSHFLLLCFSCPKLIIRVFIERSFCLFRVSVIRVWFGLLCFEFILSLFRTNQDKDKSKDQSTILTNDFRRNI